MSSNQCNVCSKQINLDEDRLIRNNLLLHVSCSNKLTKCILCSKITFMTDRCLSCLYKSQQFECPICRKNMANGQVVNSIFTCEGCAEAEILKKKENQNVVHVENMLMEIIYV